MTKTKLYLIVLLITSSFAGNIALAQDLRIGDVQDIKNILPEKTRWELTKKWAQWRIENLLPGMMTQAGIDMWIIIDRENNVDPVSASILGERTNMFGVGFMAIVNKGNRVELIDAGFRNIIRVVEQNDPQTIGINTSEIWNSCDGLSAAMKTRLENALGQYASQLVSAQDLCNEWLETKSPQELSAYRYIGGIGHDIIAEAFSNKVIIPNVTTTNDVTWWIRQKIRDVGVDNSFFPTVVLQRSIKEREKYDDPDDDFRIDVAPRRLINTVIRRGDVISADWGIEYLGLVSDMQAVAYVLKKRENDVPEGLKEALRKANRLQEIFLGEFKEDLTGNEIWFNSIRKAQAEGLKSNIYTHPIGFHGHSGGPSLGSGGTPFDPLVRGDYPMHYNTVYSVELDNSHSVPEWDGQDVIIILEDEAAFTEDGAYFLDGHQTEWYVIK